MSVVDNYDTRSGRDEWFTLARQTNSSEFAVPEVP
jgi:hypothetical protein